MTKVVSLPGKTTPRPTVGRTSAAGRFVLHKPVSKGATITIAKAKAVVREYLATTKA